MNRRLFVMAALALGGCATIASPPAVTPAPQVLGELEPLYSAVAGREGLTVRVASSGCTAKADFAFYVERRGGHATVAFGRRHVDACRSVATGQTELVFTWAELGLEARAPVFILNPVPAWTAP